MLAQSLLQCGQRIDLFTSDHLGWHRGQPRHQPIHILQLLEHRPALVAVGPGRSGREPDRKGLRKVLIRMTLRIPYIKMPYEASTIGPWAVIFGIGVGGTSKDVLSTAETTETKGIFYGMTCLMPQNSHTPFRCPTFDLKHLVHFKFLESWMGQIKRHSNTRHTIRSKPFVRQPKVRTEYELSGFEFGIELLDLS